MLYKDYAEAVEGISFGKNTKRRGGGGELVFSADIQNFTFSFLKTHTLLY